MLFTPAGYVVLAASATSSPPSRGHVRLQRAPRPAHAQCSTRPRCSSWRRRWRPSRSAAGHVPARRRLRAPRRRGVGLRPRGGRDSACEIHPYTRGDRRVETPRGRRDRRAHDAPGHVCDAGGRGRRRRHGRRRRPSGRRRGAAARRSCLEAMVTEPLRPFLRPALSSPAIPGLLSPDDARRVRRRHGAGARCARRQDLRASLAGARDMATKFVAPLPGARRGRA